MNDTVALTSQAALKLVIDLNFPGQMTEPEMRSMCSQLMYSYGANKRAPQPCQLHFTSLQVGRLAGPSFHQA